MPRDRLLEMQKIAGFDDTPPPSAPRSHSRGANAEVKQPLIDQEAEFEMFLERCSNIRQGLDTLNEEYEEISKLHGKLLSTPGADAEFTQSLNSRVETFIQRARATKESLQLLTNDTKHLPASTCGISRAKVEQVRAIYKTFETVMLKFNREQESYKSKATKKITEYLKIKNIQLSEDEIEDAISSGNLSELTKGVILAHNEKKALYDDVKSRANELFRIETQIRELAQMFHDLHLLVVSQGEMLDRIETSVQNATDYATRARGNVEEARNLQKRARKMKIIIVICSIIGIIVLIIILQTAVCIYTPIC